MWLGALVIIALLIWAMLNWPVSGADVTRGLGSTDTEAETQSGTDNNGSASKFASDIRAFDNAADSIDFNSDFSTSELDAAMNAQ